MNSSLQDDHGTLKPENIAPAPHPELPLEADGAASPEWWRSDDASDEGDAALASSPTTASASPGRIGNLIGFNTVDTKKHTKAKGVVHYISNLPWYAVIGSAFIGAAAGFYASRSYAINLASNASPPSSSTDSESAQRISNIEADMPRLSSELASLNDAIAELRNDNQKVTARVSAIENRVDRVGTDETNRVDTVDGEAKKSAADLQWLTTQFLQLKNSVDVMKMH